MRDWFEELQGLIEDGEAAVVVTVADVEGSSPQAPGARMLVTADRLVGSIGGGKLEHRAAEIARGMLGGGEPIALRRLASEAPPEESCGGLLTLVFDRVDRTRGAWLGDAARMRRGGVRPVLVSRTDSGERLLVAADESRGSLGSAELDRTAQEAARGDAGATRLARHDGVTLLVDPLYADRAIEVSVFGAGHVGAAIVRVLGAHPDVRVTWIDDRPELLPETTPDNVRIVATDDPAGRVAAFRGGEFVVVASHGHALDCDIVEQVLRRGDFRYCGLIGSGAKRGQFERRWLGQGLPAASLERLVCPIGVAGISGRQPADIAIAVAAEILQVRDAGEAVRRRGRTS